MNDIGKTQATTTAAGNLYLWFSALYAYSMTKAYPNMGVKVLAWDAPNAMKKALSEFGLEDCLSAYPFAYPRTPLNIRAVRWVLPRSAFDGAEYAYVGDVDMFIVAEHPTLAEYHIDRMTQNSLPYSNNERRCGTRMCGLHFFKIAEYWDKCGEAIEKTSRILAAVNGESEFPGKGADEVCLRQILVESGLPTRMRYKPLATPHHGIHLGLFRNGNTPPDGILRPEYCRGYAAAYESDANLKKLIAQTPPEVRRICYAAYLYCSKNENKQ